MSFYKLDSGVEFSEFSVGEANVIIPALPTSIQEVTVS